MVLVQLAVCWPKVGSILTVLHVDQEEGRTV